MITDALLALGWVVMQIFVTLLPSSEGLPAEFETSLQGFFDRAWSFNGVLPIDSLFSILGALFLFEFAVYSYRFVRWLLASVPFSSIKH